ncbi:type II 3-dehydroquinate dehydratase [Luteimicrobium subarcticum]|uniref:3-dehydroquinate dehydratase n=1 Tax=Luteimicrobium subarcticum TaxID=620910 RepID=A0A2M8W3V6_9MICO|nr:type II 3-dehydroquinate dehydratase [Luteimicrobium subarcticum]PJI85616.1 3-dehydroquinate dehydratase [Luteimicrobium subarcticum]
MTRVLILNGPNLGRLGVREPDVYGALSFDDLRERATAWAGESGLDAEVRQTDDEAEIVRWLHEAVDAGAHVVLNPAAFTHYSYSLRDAAAQVTRAGLLLVEVHISNPMAREEFRHTSVVGPVATGTVAGFGFDSYRLALAAIAGRLAADKPATA